MAGAPEPAPGCYLTAWGKRNLGGLLPNGFYGGLDRGTLKQAVGNEGAFALRYAEGYGTAFGSRSHGGSGAFTIGRLDNGLLNLFATKRAFAGLKRGGTLFFWGDDFDGGRLPDGRDTLDDVVTVASTRRAFAALHGNGSISAWGRGDYGGNATAAAFHEGEAFTSVLGNDAAFAAVNASGHILAWGDKEAGGVGRPTSIAWLGSEAVESMAATDSAFAVVSAAGRLGFWGHPDEGGLGPDQTDLDHLSGARFVELTASKKAFAARDDEGRVSAWGSYFHGGAVLTKRDALLAGGFSRVYANDVAFAAVSDAGLVCWGGEEEPPYNDGGNCDHLAALAPGFGGVRKIVGNSEAFAALTGNGSILAWGDEVGGGALPANASGLAFTDVVANPHAFTAITAGGGRAVSWGNPYFGGEIPAFERDVLAADVVAVYANDNAFLAAHNCSRHDRGAPTEAPSPAPPGHAAASLADQWFFLGGLLVVLSFSAGLLIFKYTSARGRRSLLRICGCRGRRDGRDRRYLRYDSQRQQRTQTVVATCAEAELAHVVSAEAVVAHGGPHGGRGGLEIVPLAETVTVDDCASPLRGVYIADVP